MVVDIILACGLVFGIESLHADVVEDQGFLWGILVYLGPIHIFIGKSVDQ